MQASSETKRKMRRKERADVIANLLINDQLLGVSHVLKLAIEIFVRYVKACLKASLPVGEIILQCQQ